MSQVSSGNDYRSWVFNPFSLPGESEARGGEAVRMRGVKNVIAVSITLPHPNPLPGREREDQEGRSMLSNCDL